MHLQKSVKVEMSQKETWSKSALLYSDTTVCFAVARCNIYTAASSTGSSTGEVPLAAKIILRHRTRHVQPWSSSIRSCDVFPVSHVPKHNLNSPRSSTDPCVFLLPLNSPLHNFICDDHRYRPVQDLVTGASESVEDGGVGGSRERVLAVLSEAVLGDAFLWLAAYDSQVSISMPWIAHRAGEQ